MRRLRFPGHGRRELLGSDNPRGEQDASALRVLRRTDGSAVKWTKETPEQAACDHQFVARGDLKICGKCHSWRRGLHLGEILFVLVFLCTYKGTGH